MVDALYAVGLVLLLASAAAAWFNRRAVVEGRPRPWRWIFEHRWALGLLLALISPFLGYPAEGEGGRWKIMGIPFAVACFDPKGLDYVSPLTPVLMALNGVFWLLLPQLPLWLSSGRRRAPRA